MNGRKGVHGRGLERAELPLGGAASRRVGTTTGAASVCKFAVATEAVGLVVVTATVGYGPLLEVSRSRLSSSLSACRRGAKRTVIGEMVGTTAICTWPTSRLT